MAGQSSLPYVVGATLEFGPTGFEAYEAANLSHKRVLHWADLVQFEPDEELEALNPAHLGSEVEIVHRGSHKAVRVIDSVGTATRPLDWRQISEKVAGVTRALQPPLDLGRLQRCIQDLPWRPSIADLEAAVMAPSNTARP